MKLYVMIILVFVWFTRDVVSSHSDTLFAGLKMTGSVSPIYCDHGARHKVVA